MRLVSTMTRSDERGRKRSRRSCIFGCKWVWTAPLPPKKHSQRMSVRASPSSYEISVPNLPSVKLFREVSFFKHPALVLIKPHREAVKLALNQCLMRANERIKELAQDHMIIIDTHDRQKLAFRANAVREPVFRGVQVSNNERTIVSEVSDREVRPQVLPLTLSSARCTPISTVSKSFPGCGF
jgi:hypothetical protein